MLRRFPFDVVVRDSTDEVLVVPSRIRRVAPATGAAGDSAVAR
jgi:hypothetical protein